MTCLYQTLIDIEVVTSSSTFQASLVIVSRSLGSILGAMILGRLYEKLHHNLLLGAFCLLAASVTLPIAYVQSIYGTYALAAIAGVAIGAKDTGGQEDNSMHWCLAKCLQMSMNISNSGVWLGGVKNTFKIV